MVRVSKETLVSSFQLSRQWSVPVDILRSTKLNDVFEVNSRELDESCLLAPRLLFDPVAEGRMPLESLCQGEFEPVDDLFLRMMQTLEREVIAAGNLTRAVFARGMPRSIVSA